MTAPLLCSETVLGWIRTIIPCVTSSAICRSSAMLSGRDEGGAVPSNPAAVASEGQSRRSPMNAQAVTTTVQQMWTGGLLSPPPRDRGCTRGQSAKVSTKIESGCYSHNNNPKSDKRKIQPKRRRIIKGWRYGKEKQEEWRSSVSTRLMDFDRGLGEGGWDSPGHREPAKTDQPCSGPIRCLGPCIYIDPNPES